ncbi:MFS transporter [Flagellimonas aquimarina]|jgi:predicted MFS family arabinose efflux permease|uniref:MFS transporter n=1 Tax=Flagellimonas aquimarina TaxID=2201895 RepID=A0A316L1G7_9FLAO|nr:MFS transporter [Allomuricauda koreensis]PWL39681.1 MFS transporter [Allomuricauda koreensis]
MENINKNRLFVASCVALLVTAMTFAIRARLETVFGPEGVGLTLEQIGWAFTPAFWGFTIAMIVGGPLVDSLGIKKITWIAFITHAIGIIWTILAKDQTSLFLATLFVGIGNGMVEAALNPMIASMYTKNKTKMLNRFHVWFPGGIVIGSLVGWLVMDVMGLGWQVMVGVLFIPLIVYGFMFLGQNFPVTERVQMGVSNNKMIASLGKPLFIFMVLCMFLTAASELGTTQRIESLLKESVAVPLLVLAFINGIMALGRAFAGKVIHKLQPAGMLLFSAVFTFIGLWLLTITSGGMTFAAAAVFAVGVTFFWPTMLGFVAEYLPETGALGLSIMGGAGMLSVSVVLPVMGNLMDNASAIEALRTMSILPAILIVAFIGLYIYMKKRKTETA